MESRESLTTHLAKANPQPAASRVPPLCHSRSWRSQQCEFLQMWLGSKYLHSSLFSRNPSQLGLCTWINTRLVSILVQWKQSAPWSRIPGAGISGIPNMDTSLHFQARDCSVFNIVLTDHFGCSGKVYVSCSGHSRFEPCLGHHLCLLRFFLLF